MSDDTTGEARIYYYVPSAPDEANAASVIELAESVMESGKLLRSLEALGWEPRWPDNGNVGETEIAYDKRFASEADAEREIDQVGLGLPVAWYED